jgi:adenosine deaminase CECR1
MTDEYFVAVKHFNLSWSEIMELGRNSLQQAFLTEAEKIELLQAFEVSLQAFEEKQPFANVDRLEACTYGYGKQHLGLEGVFQSVPTSGPVPVVSGLSSVG